MMLDPISFSHSHTGGCSKCCNDSCCDRCNQLHDKLNGFFLTHIDLDLIVKRSLGFAAWHRQEL